jgi:hypothetical protein
MTIDIENDARSYCWATASDFEKETRMFWRMANEVRRSSARDNDEIARQDIEELSSYALHTKRVAIRRAVLAGLRAALQAPNPAARTAAARALIEVGEDDTSLWASFRPSA